MSFDLISSFFWSEQILLVAGIGCLVLLPIVLLIQKSKNIRLIKNSDKINSKLKILTSVIDELTTPILTLDQDNLISYANSRFKQKFNCKGRDIEGLHICAFLDREIYSKITDLIDVAEKSKSHKAEKTVFCRLANNSLINFNLLLEVKQQEKDRVYILSFLEVEKEKKEEDDDKDEFLIQKYLSELEHSRLQLKKQSDELLEARDKALQATNAKSSFLANMSHEIRTPMNGLLGVTNFMQETNLSEEQKGYLRVIQDCTESLLTLINDILDFSKIEAGKLTLSPICTDIYKILEKSAVLYHFPLNDKSIRLEKNISPDVPQYLMADNTRLQQILNNLLSNAIKFTPENGTIKIQVALHNVSEQSVALKFSVSDNGIGISKEAQKRIFEAFEQADSSTTRKYGGTGLGLSICSALVKLMNGNIWVEGDVNEGTTFHFVIELDVPNKEELERLRNNSNSESASANATISAQKELTILIAEDNLINQKVLTKLVEKMGHKVQTVKNGEEVLEAIKNTEFNLILMDGQMPVMDGYEATRLIREKERASAGHIPVIAVTASAMKSDEVRCKEAGMDDYISKPIDRSKLEELLLKYSQS